MNNKTKGERELLYKMMYTAVSGATAKDSVFNGTVSELFRDIQVTPATITRFLWAVSHKTAHLPIQLFSIIDRGNKGKQIKRVHTGFKDPTTNERIDGVKLTPFIMRAAKLAPVQHRKQPQNEPESPRLIDFSNLTDEQLVELDRQINDELRAREERHAIELARQKRIEELREALKFINMSAEEVADLIGVI